MPVEELLLIVASLVAIGVSAVHVYDRFHPRGFYHRTLDLAQRNTALVVTKLGEVGPAVGSEVEGALNRVAAQQEANIGSGLDEAKQAQDALLARFDGIQASLAALPSAFGAELRKLAEEQTTAIEAEAKKLESSAAMSMVRSVGVDRQLQARVAGALSEAILGPALPILRQFAPGLADALEENPQLVDYVIQNPLFKKYIEPRIMQFMGNAQASGSADVSGWGT